MFREANAIAHNFTWPVVISRRAVSGKCSAGIGSMIVLNKEGWALTAGHIIQMCAEIEANKNQLDQLEAQIAAINADGSLSNKERRKRLAHYWERYHQTPSGIFRVGGVATVLNSSTSPGSPILTSRSEN